MRRWLIGACGFVMLVVLVSSIAQAGGGGPAVDWDVIGSGGGHGVSGGTAVDVTIGQAVVGVAGTPARTVCVGFWCGVIPNWAQFLPVIGR